MPYSRRDFRPPLLYASSRVPVPFHFPVLAKSHFYVPCCALGHGFALCAACCRPPTPPVQGDEVRLVEPLPQLLCCVRRLAELCEASGAPPDGQAEVGGCGAVAPTVAPTVAATAAAALGCCPRLLAAADQRTFVG